MTHWGAGGIFAIRITGKGATCKEIFEIEKNENLIEKWVKDASRAYIEERKASGSGT